MILSRLAPLICNLSGHLEEVTSCHRAVTRPQRVLEDILDDLEGEVAGLLHLRVDGVAKNPDNERKEVLAEVIEERKVGRNTYQAVQDLGLINVCHPTLAVRVRSKSHKGAFKYYISTLGGGGG